MMLFRSCFPLYVVAVSWVALQTVPQVSADPLFEQIDVFPARQEGYHHVRIPGIVVSSKGTVLAFGEARHSEQGTEDWADIDLVLRRSTDGGKSWSAMQVLEDGARFVNQRRNSKARRKPGQEKFVTCNNPVMIVDRAGDVIHFLYCVEYDRCYYCRSTDDGASFSAPMEITEAFAAFRPEYDWKVLATGPGHGIQLTNGRLVVPVWLSTGDGGGGHRPSCVSTIYSDDRGTTWRRGEIAVNHPDLANPSETVTAQLADGRVVLNIRSENQEHRRAVCFSADGATAWTKPEFDDELIEPVCMASLVRVSTAAGTERSRLLFCNPVSTKPRDPVSKNQMYMRENLTLRLSYDEGQSWPVTKVLDSGAAGYSDLAVGPDGTIYCLYERGGSRTAFDPEAITCARFNCDWLTGGKDPWRPDKD